jgi:hypothetical protein
MTFAINNARIATKNKAAPTTSAGDFARFYSAFIQNFSYEHVRLSSANKPAFECLVDRTQPGGCGRSHAVPGFVEPVPTGGMICIIYQTNKNIEREFSTNSRL